MTTSPNVSYQVYSASSPGASSGVQQVGSGATKVVHLTRGQQLPQGQQQVQFTQLQGQPGFQGQVYAVQTSPNQQYTTYTVNQQQQQQQPGATYFISGTGGGGTSPSPQVYTVGSSSTSGGTYQGGQQGQSNTQYRVITTPVGPDRQGSTMTYNYVQQSQAVPGQQQPGGQTSTVYYGQTVQSQQQPIQYARPAVSTQQATTGTGSATSWGNQSGSSQQQQWRSSGAQQQPQQQVYYAGGSQTQFSQQQQSPPQQGPPPAAQQQTYQQQAYQLQRVNANAPQASSTTQSTAGHPTNQQQQAGYAVGQFQHQQQPISVQQQQAGPTYVQRVPPPAPQPQATAVVAGSAPRFGDAPPPAPVVAQSVMAQQQHKPPPTQQQLRFQTQQHQQYQTGQQAVAAGGWTGTGQDLVQQQHIQQQHQQVAFGSSTTINSGAQNRPPIGTGAAVGSVSGTGVSHQHQYQSSQQGQFAQSQIRERAPSASGGFRHKTLPMRMAASMDDLNATEPPQFSVHPIGQATVNEGDSIILRARVGPAGDPKLRVEWYKDGRPLTAVSYRSHLSLITTNTTSASRFTTSFERGYAVLEFLYTNEDDSGSYFCAATNSLGQAQSTVCSLTIIPEQGVVTETQLPEESMVANLAAMEDQLIQDGLARSGPRYRDELRATQPPTFVKALAPQSGLKEQDPAHFELIVEPANDPSLRVDWFKDGQPVSTGCRFTTAFDRGFASLDIHYCYPEDSGAYFCIATNSLGQAQSNVVDLQCSAAEKIITNSLLSQDSVTYLQSLDSWHSETMAGYDTVQTEEQEQPSAPSFDIQPIELNVTEGSPARFLVKAGGFPRPKLLWYMDDELMPSHGGAGNWRIYQDGGISHLEIHRVGTQCEHRIRVVAKNANGESSVETRLIIHPPQDYRPDLRHVQPENPFRKLVHLKKVDRTQELDNAFQRTKPHAINLRKLEREQEAKGRNEAEQEALVAENIYNQVQSQLRSHRMSGMMPTPQPKLMPTMRPAGQQQTQRAAAPPPQPRPVAPPPQPAPAPPPVARPPQPAPAPPPVARPPAPPPPPPVAAPPPPAPAPPPPPPPAPPVQPAMMASHTINLEPEDDDEQQVIYLDEE